MNTVGVHTGYTPSAHSPTCLRSAILAWRPLGRACLHARARLVLGGPRVPPARSLVASVSLFHRPLHRGGARAIALVPLVRACADLSRGPWRITRWEKNRIASSVNASKAFQRGRARARRRRREHRRWGEALRAPRIARREGGPQRTRNGMSRGRAVGTRRRRRHSLEQDAPQVGSLRTAHQSERPTAPGSGALPAEGAWESAICGRSLGPGRALCRGSQLAKLRADQIGGD